MMGHTCPNSPSRLMLMHSAQPKKTGRRRGSRIYQVIYIPKHEYELVRQWEERYGHHPFQEEYNKFIKGRKKLDYADQPPTKKPVERVIQKRKKVSPS